MTYEELLTMVHDLDHPAGSDDRQIAWCTPAARLGIARDAVGRVEIFLVTELIETKLRAIRENLEFETWYRRDGEPVNANRLVLPAAPHFEQVAAFLCVELLRSDVDADPVGAFRRTERIIELTIQRLRIGDEVVLGLFGEMVLLAAMLELVDDDGVAAVVESWTGHNNVARDLQLQSVGVEVKTTTGPTSSHNFQGVHQCEIGHGVAGAEEADFFVASIGVEPVEPGAADALTLPQVIDRSLQRAQDVFGQGSALADNLIERIKNYGAPDEGYDHRATPRAAAFERSFRTTFVRLFDMTDSGMLVLSSADLSARPFVAAESVRFRADFPIRVTGDLNPVAGLHASASTILARSGLTSR